MARNRKENQQQTKITQPPGQQSDRHERANAGVSLWFADCDFYG